MPNKKSKKKRTKRRKTSSLKMRKLFGGAIENNKYFYKDSIIKELKGNDFVGGSVTHSSFKNKPGLIMWYADWCPHCSNQETIKMWKDVGTFCDPDLVVGAVNCANESNGSKAVSEMIGIQGFPSITYVNVDGTIDTDKFNNQRTKDNIIKFVCSKVTQPGQLAMCSI